jgi:hypothetical protein
MDSNEEETRPDVAIIVDAEGMRRRREHVGVEELKLRP